MKHVRKALAFALTLFMAFAIALPAFAQDATPTGTITISNSAKGATYKVFQLFGATNSVKQNADGESASIAYTGTIPSSLSAYFVKDATTGEITATDAAKNSNGELSDAAIAALKAWAGTQTATEANTKTGTGGELTFTVPYGYYVVTTTQGDTAISVDSTNPDASIIDKNTTAPITPPDNDTTHYKTVTDDDLSIGEETTYTISFGTSNYFDKTNLITEYVITDNFADGKLEHVGNPTVKIDDEVISSYTVEAWGTANAKIVIPWCNTAKDASLYRNGALITVTYNAKLVSDAYVAGNGNTNTATINYKYKNPNDNPDDPNDDEIPGTSVSDTETVYTYAFAIKKVDQAGQNLAGAKFHLPFYVAATPADDGAYVYAGTTAGNGLVNELTTPDDGLIIIKGVQSGNYTITEVEAPQGYNKLTKDVTATATKTTATTTTSTTYLDKDGKIVKTETTGGSTVLVEIGALAATPIVVVNRTGNELPSTGGIGTTIFYVVGGVLVAGAVIFLLTKRRVAAE